MPLSFFSYRLHWNLSTEIAKVAIMALLMSGKCTSKYITLHIWIGVLRFHSPELHMFATYYLIPHFLLTWFLFFQIAKFSKWVLWNSLGTLQGSPRGFLHFGECWLWALYNKDVWIYLIFLKGIYLNKYFRSWTCLGLVCGMFGIPLANRKKQSFSNIYIFIYCK